MENIPPNIFKLVASYISKDISEEEFDELKNWLESKPGNKQLFFDYLYVYKKSRAIKFSENIDSEKAWNQMVIKLKKRQGLNKASQKDSIKVKRLKKRVTSLKYAAVAVFLLGIGYWYQNSFLQNKTKVDVPPNRITLQLHDGRIQIIDESGVSKVVDSKGQVVGEQKGVQLVYGKEAATETLVYNTLTIPYGKRFEIELSDGTRVHLNAGSSLKYPVNFVKGKDRKVFLNGEAYFNVAKDAEHPFIVNTEDMDVRVLGTQFNISSYPEDDNINTVLVEGAVGIYKEGSSYSPETATELKPGFKAIWRKKDQNVTVKEADIEMATAWIEGKIIFRRTPFNDIVKKLERHYNVTIVNNNEVLGKQLFGASFDVETIEEVLESFSANFKIEYTIQNNKVTIN